LQRYCSTLQQRASAKLCGVVYSNTEWNYGTFADGATYIWLGGHHVGHAHILVDFCCKMAVGRPPSCIHLMHIVTLHKKHLVFFIAVQNLAGIDAVIIR